MAQRLDARLQTVGVYSASFDPGGAVISDRVVLKFEANGDVGFVVVLLTPDDEGGKIGEPRKRARQNVLLEWVISLAA